MEENIKITKLIKENFISKITYFSEYISKIKVLENEKFIRVDSSLPSDTFNIGVIKKTDLEDFDFILADIINYFNKKSFPAAVWLWENIENKIINQMEEKGFEFAEKELGMYIPLNEIKLNKSCTEDFVIRVVSSKKEINIFGEILGSIFGNSEEAVYVKEFYRLLGKEDVYKGENLKFYIGFFNDEPVSTGALYFTEKSIGIYDISTKETYRNRGFGSAVFDYLLNEIKDDDREYCILQASEDGAGIYKNRGFREAGIIEVYENRNFLEKQSAKNLINSNK